MAHSKENRNHKKVRENVERTLGNRNIRSCRLRSHLNDDKADGANNSQRGESHVDHAQADNPLWRSQMAANTTSERQDRWIPV